MRRASILCIAALAVAMQPTYSRAAEADSTDTVQRLTLPEAYALANARSETLAIGAEEWHAAEARYRQATAGRWPELSAVGTGNWRETGGTSGANRTTRAGLGGTYPIFTGFRTTHLVEARAAEEIASEQDLIRARQVLYLDVADAFYAALAADLELAALDAELQALEDQQAELQRRIKLGRSRRAELLSVQSEVANLRATVAESDGERAAARELLAFLIGRSLSDDRLVDDSPLPAAPAVERFLEESEKRPDIRAEEARSKGAEAEMRAARSERGLSVDAGAHVYAYSDPGEAGDWDLTVSAAVPLFDSGLRRAATAERAAEARISELRLAQVRRTADRDVRAAYTDLVSALAQWAALHDAATVADENVGLQREDYEQGRAANLDVLSALVQQHDLQRRAAQAEMQARAALVRLHVAAGTPP